MIVAKNGELRRFSGQISARAELRSGKNSCQVSQPVKKLSVVKCVERNPAEPGFIFKKEC